MKLFIYETHIPAWSNSSTLAMRIDQWKRAGISAVFLVVDDGKGSTWPSTICPLDPRIVVESHPLKSAIQTIRRAGISVILVVNVIGIVQIGAQIKPEWYLPSNDYYDLWNVDFFQWRLDYISELVSYTDCDGLALDYIRTGKPSSQDQLPASTLVRNFLYEVKKRIPFHLSLTNISSTVYVNPNSQGVDFLSWYNEKLVDSILVYNYSDQFPFNDVRNIPEKAMWILNSNMRIVNNTAISKTKQDFDAMCFTMRKRFDPHGYGMYNSNMLTEDHIETLSLLHLRERPR